jgi:DNA-binding SARP family transcriptional activator
MDAPIVGESSRLFVAPITHALRIGRAGGGPRNGAGPRTLLSGCYESATVPESRLEGGMRFTLLGPLRAYVDDQEVAITAPREQVALAVLLLRAGETVPVTHLVDAIWPDAPPVTARNQVQASVSRLRRQLTGAGASDAVIVTELGGYRLQVDRRDVDLHEFRSLVTSARTAAAEGKPKDATDRYRTALGLWKGPAFIGLESAELSGVANALEQERIQALEECLDIELQLGADGSLVAELTELVRQHPYREGLRATLMRALYRSGRSAEALEEYQRVRMLLREELGTEPSEELRRLHKAILNGDPSLDPPTSQPAGISSAVRELPAEPSRFVGRNHEMAEVRAALLPADRDARRPTVAVIYGPGGVGKSALAVRTSHDLATEFPDGQLYVDLCGSTPGLRPMTAIEVLGRFLRRLGVPPEQIPSDEAEAAAFFRSATADRHLLLLLDNAAGTDQITPLIPASPTCGVLVTSRHPLASLDADYRLRLGVLGGAEGLALLTSLTDRLAAEPEAARSILALSGGLPLAIRIAAGRLACRPDLSAAEYAQRLADRSRRLDELQLDDLAVRASIRTSYDELLSGGDPARAVAARAFRMLGLLHVPDVAPGVVAAMLREPDPEVARSALDRLIDAQLLEPFGEGRYRLHDLVRLVAAERAIEEDVPFIRDAAVQRAIAYYTGAIWRAETLLSPDTKNLFGDIPFRNEVTLPHFEGITQCRDWVDEELFNLVAALEHMNALGGARRLILWLSFALWGALDVRCEWRTAHRLSRAVVEAGDATGDPELGACGHLLLGRSKACLGDFAGADPHFERSIVTFGELGNDTGVAIGLNGRGINAGRAGDDSRALVLYAEALEVARRVGLVMFAGVVLSNMSVSYARLGRLDHSVQAAEEGATIAQAASAGRRNASSAFLNLAAVYCMRGAHAKAVCAAGLALRLSSENGDRLRECEALIIRSEASRRGGSLEEALIDAEKACNIAQSHDNRYASAIALGQRAALLGALGREAGDIEALAREALSRIGGIFRDPMIEILFATQEEPLTSAPHPSWSVSPVE